MRSGNVGLDRPGHATRHQQTLRQRNFVARLQCSRKRNLSNTRFADRESVFAQIGDERESKLDADKLLRAMASGDVDSVASELPEEFRDAVDTVKRCSDNDDIEGILEVAQEALKKTSELLKQDKENENG